MAEHIHRRGRGAALNPANPYERFHLEEDPAELDEKERRAIPTTFHTDASRTILSRNDSPDVPFTWSLNPYRGCEHGCVYCYARPGHEYLGYSAGLDFETHIMVKHDAAHLLAETFERPSWKPAVVALSGATDPYQPAERRLRITRQCLEVFLRYRNPVALITKNHLVTRDIDLLAEMARLDIVHVNVSVTSLRDDVTAGMEPRTSRPARRLDAIRELTEAGIRCGVMVAPVIPGLTDEEVPAILAAAREAGAVRASWIPVRLPGAVEPIFREWLERVHPGRAEKVLARIRSMRGGELNDGRFGKRMQGEGPWADILNALFRQTTRRLGYEGRAEAEAGSEAGPRAEHFALTTRHFRRSQGDLFGLQGGRSVNTP
ncbi:MAG: PA0069 family radical SAM protein [Rhodothermales bacterium]